MSLGTFIARELTCDGCLGKTETHSSGPRLNQLANFWALVRLSASSVFSAIEPTAAIIRSRGASVAFRRGATEWAPHCKLMPGRHSTCSARQDADLSWLGSRPP